VVKMMIIIGGYDSFIHTIIDYQELSSSLPQLNRSQTENIPELKCFGTPFIDLLYFELDSFALSRLRNQAR